MMFPSNRLSAITFLCVGVLSSTLTGCTLATTAAPDPAAGAAIAGKVHGGQQPVTGAKIYLLAANPAGYGSGSLSLLTTALTGHAVDTIGAYGMTNGAGLFSVTGEYSCTTGYSQGASTASGGVALPGDEQVYLYVSGGNPGLDSGDNTNIGLLAALGPCNAQFSPTLEVNEITTVAAAYAFAGYASDATHLSSSGSALALKGLANAGLNSRNLANVITGTAATTVADVTNVPTGNIVTIANILASCVNGATGNNSCTTLFQNTEASGTAATETATAAIHLAQNPYPSSGGVTALYSLVSGTPAFGGGLTTQPNDFTLGLTFYQSNCFNNGGHGLAIDASGSAFALGGHGVCKFSSNGISQNAYYGFNYGGCLIGGSNLAIDTSGNVWIPDFNFNRLCEISNSGTAITTNSGFTGGGISEPRDVAIDGLGNVWTANQSGSLSKFSSNGVAVSGSNGYTDSGVNVSFYGIAIDTSGSVWAANYDNGSVSKFSNNGTALSPATGFYGGGAYNPYDVAIDASGDVWTANYGNDSLSTFSSAGVALSPDKGAYGGYNGGGLNSPQSIAIDSTGKVWSSNENGSTVSVFTNSGVPLSGDPAYNADSGMYVPVSIALDGSGDVWVTNADGSLTELIGASSPVVTPVVANLVAPYGSAAVNRP